MTIADLGFASKTDFERDVIPVMFSVFKDLCMPLHAILRVSLIVGWRASPLNRWA